MGRLARGLGEHAETRRRDGGGVDQNRLKPTVRGTNDAGGVQRAIVNRRIGYLAGGASGPKCTEIPQNTPSVGAAGVDQKRPKATFWAVSGHAETRRREWARG